MAPHIGEPGPLSREARKIRPPRGTRYATGNRRKGGFRANPPGAGLGKFAAVMTRPTQVALSCAPLNDRGPAMTALIVYCTVPDEDAAGRIAGSLVDEGLAACVSRLPGLVSTYRWQGRTETASEILLLIKTVRPRFEALRERLVALHPYELPEVIAVDVALGHAPYLDWIAAATDAAA